MAQPIFHEGVWSDPPGGLIDTFHEGRTRLMATAALQREAGSYSNDDESCWWVEYRLDGEIVHRSAHVRKKTGMFADGFQASF